MYVQVLGYVQNLFEHIVQLFTEGLKTLYLLDRILDYIYLYLYVLWIVNSFDYYNFLVFSAIVLTLAIYLTALYNLFDYY